LAKIKYYSYFRNKCKKGALLEKTGFKTMRFPRIFHLDCRLVRWVKSPKNVRDDNGPRFYSIAQWRRFTTQTYV